MLDLLSPPSSFAAGQPLIGQRLDPFDPLADGLKGYWPFADGAGPRVTDFSGLDHAASQNNMDPATDWVRGPRGAALEFDATDDYLQVGTHRDFEFSTAFTLAIRCRQLDAAYSAGKVLGLVNKYEATAGNRSYTYMLYHVNGKIRPYVYVAPPPGNAGTACDPNFDLDDTDWHLLAFTFDRGAWVHYLDGRPIGAGNTGFTTLHNASSIPLRLGVDYDAREFDGPIDFVCVLSRALSPAGILTLGEFAVCGAREPWFGVPNLVRSRLISATGRRPSRRKRPRTRVFDFAAQRGKRYFDARGNYRIFNAATYRFYRSDSGPPAESDSPFATNATLPHEPADEFTDATWWISLSYFNGVIDSGFLPLGLRGETYLRLDLSGGAEDRSPPAAPLDWRLEQRPGGVVRVIGTYYESGANRADKWNVGYRIDGSDPPADTPGDWIAIPAANLAVLEYDLPGFDDDTTVKVRLQTYRDDGDLIYSENSTVKTTTADAAGPTAPLGGDRWPGSLPEDL